MRYTTALVTIASVSCVTTAPARAPDASHDRASTASDAPMCPTPTLDLVARCASPDPARGRSPERALEWGAMVQGRLGHDRLVCEDGSELRRVSRASTAGVRSTSPRSSVPKFGDGANDIVDMWTVSCPGRAEETLYSNLYRCGDPCPPAGFRWLRADAEALFVTALKTKKSGQPERALSLLDEAVALEPNAEKYRKWRDVLRLEVTRSIDVARALIADAERNPDDLEHADFVSFLVAKFSEPSLALEFVERVESRADPRGRAYFMCRRANLLMETGRVEEAPAVAKAACELGEKKCCAGGR